METPNKPDFDFLAESDEWLAALIRQLFRAHRANDSKALEVTLRHFDDCAFKVLNHHLRTHESLANKGRWFDGMQAAPEFATAHVLRLRGDVAWVDKLFYYYDPFDFEFELCPGTGKMIHYVLRFGDSRGLSAKTLTAKVEGGATIGIPVLPWVYEIRRIGEKP